MVEKFVSNVICVLNDFKILFEDEGDYSGLLFFLLLLLFIEEDEFLGFLVNDMLNKELKYLFKVSEFVKMVRIVEKINFDLLIKGVNFIKSLSEVNGLNGIMNDNYSFLLRIVKWQGYGRNFFEDRFVSSMLKIRVGVLKIGIGILERQFFLDFVVILRMFKYEIFYSFR